ncbi:probable thylakoidal processing peptidase 2, chloroplastic [Quercus lobata]|uniref:probable thylakoidal processing peptidase 2, chloroplastic n=1 Tax=Quercus lobata TaxID=97700 RepID=UPI0012444AD9|nr:probable thylakoidal processing peptidase 2, chloroplastic [Quercus lobata]
MQERKSGHLVQNLATLASLRVGNCKTVGDCWIRTRIFETNQKTKFDPASTVRNYHFDLRMPSLFESIVGEIIDENSKSPIVLGLISVMRSTACASGTSATALGVFRVSPFKSSSILSSVSKWVLPPCNDEPETSSESSTTITTMKMATTAESKFDQKSGWLSKILNLCSEDAKAVFTAVTVSILFKSYWKSGVMEMLFGLNKETLGLVI